MTKRKRLPELGTGQCGRVTGYEGAERDRLRLMEMGILEGTVVRVVRRAPLGDPLEVEVRGFHLSLRATEAGRIEVEDVAC